MMTEARCYTIAQILEWLQMSKGTFARQRKAGALPFLEELRPRIGRRQRFRADLIDRYVAGEWQRPAFVFGRKRNSR
jgi:hypothetical protein